MAGTETTTQRSGAPSWLLRTLLALTGLTMAAFVLVHMLGNLKILFDAPSMDAYAGWLREVLVPLLPREGLLWIFRAVLLICVLLHVWCALVLKARARRLRTPGARTRAIRALLARLMLPTGLLLLAWLAVHLLDLTIGAWVAPVDFAAPDPAFHASHNVVASLSRPLMAGAYGLALLALGAHLAHGIGLAVKDLGATGPKGLAAAERIGVLVAALIVLGDGAVLVFSLATGALP